MAIVAASVEALTWILKNYMLIIALFAKIFSPFRCWICRPGSSDWLVCLCLCVCGYRLGSYTGPTGCAGGGPGGICASGLWRTSSCREDWSKEGQRSFIFVKETKNLQKHTRIVCDCFRWWVPRTRNFKQMTVLSSLTTFSSCFPSFCPRLFNSHAVVGTSTVSGV